MLKKVLKYVTLICGVICCFITFIFSSVRLLSLFDSLSPPGEMTSYEDGLLLAIVSMLASLIISFCAMLLCGVEQMNYIKQKKK